MRKHKPEKTKGEKNKERKKKKIWFLVGSRAENNNLVHDKNFKSYSQSTPWYHFQGNKNNQSTKRRKRNLSFAGSVGEYKIQTLCVLEIMRILWKIFRYF